MNSPQIKLADPQINAQDPWSDDALDRKFCGETLTKFLENQTAALTIGVNGAWGTGKTFFLRRWEESLKKDGYEVVYFNAWKDDCLDDPLIAIVGQLWKKLKGGTFKEVCDSLKSAAVPVLSKVGLSVLNRGLQIVSGVSVDGINKECLQTGTESAFDQYVSLTDAREDFRTRLQRLADKVFDKTGKPLIYIVDELDRCRPDFAIKVLERIKHLFDIDHVIFVLGIDREQLGRVIQSVYGNIDVENYLLRFIDVDFSLPETNHMEFFNALWKRHGMPNYLETRIRSLPVNVHFLGHPILADTESTTEYLKELFALHRFSLREIERGLNFYKVAMMSTSNHERILPELISVLVLLRIRNNELYEKFLNLTCSLDEIAKFIFPAPLCSPQKDWRKIVVLSAVFSVFKNHMPLEESSEIKILQEIEKGAKSGSSCIFKLLPDTILRAKFHKLVMNTPNFHFSQADVFNLAQKMDLIFRSRVTYEST